MSFQTRLKEARLAKEYTQEQLANIIGVAKSTYTGYEKGNREPNMLTISKILDALGVDANYLWQDEMKELTAEDSATPDEMENLVKKYRALDEHGKKNVNNILNNEYERCTALKEGQICFSFSDDHEFNIVKNGKLIPYVMETPNVKAAHNDHADEKGELEKMQEDISNLKRP